MFIYNMFLDGFRRQYLYLVQLFWYSVIYIDLESQLCLTKNISEA